MQKCQDIATYDDQMQADLIADQYEAVANIV